MSSAPWNYPYNNNWMNLPPPTSKQARLIWLAVTGLAIATLAALVVGLIWGLGQVLQILSPVLWPLAIAGVIAYLLDPIVDRFEKKGLSRAKAIICVFGIAVLILGAVFGSVIPQIVRETRQLAGRIPEMTTHLMERLEKWANDPPPWAQRFFKNDVPSPENQNAAASTNDIPLAPTNSPVVTNDVPADSATSTNSPGLLTNALDKNTLQSATGWVAQSLPTIGHWLSGQAGRVAGWFGILAGLALIPVYAFYLLLEKEGIRSKWTNYLPVSDSRFKDETVFILRSINDYLIAFFRGQVLVAICDSILYTIGFLIIGLPYAVLLGFAAIFLTLIPFLGAIGLCAAALVIALVQYGDWLHPLLVLAVFGIVQTLEGLVISPKIMGDRVGLHPLTIIIAVMAGTTLLGGLLGGILAIPLTAVLRVLMGRYVWKRRNV
jgi:predicted PurR-regulated permease PerM